jgi:beta-phosphoglucomutase
MSLKAVLFDFNGVILDDEPIHQQLINQILLAENLRSKQSDYWEFCLGRSDRDCLKALLGSRGRVVTEAYLATLIAQKAEAYQQRLAALEQLPLFPGVQELVRDCQAAQLKMAIVSGALRSEIEAVLEQAELTTAFSIIVAAEDAPISKPQPDPYRIALEQLHQNFPELNLKPENCLVIEDTFAGIQSARSAGMAVVGVAHTYPFHMLQRRANWTVDALGDLELERVQAVFEPSSVCG